MPGPGGYWLRPARRASTAASTTAGGPSWSGKPCPRLRLPVRTASADISEKIVGGIDRSRLAIRVLGIAGIPRLYGVLLRRLAGWEMIGRMAQQTLERPAVAAHRVTHGEPLRDMPKLRPGDEILVETKQATYTYRLDTDPNDLVVTFRDVWVIDPLPRNPGGGVQPAQRPGQRLLTLTTCAELFHTDHRMIAFAHLVGTRSR